MKTLSIMVMLATCAAEAMEPIVPVMWRRGAVEETARDLREIRAKSGLSRFFVAGPGFNEVMYAPFATNLYAEMGREIGEIARLVAPDGVEVGWWCSPSIRYVSGFAPVEDAFGGKSQDNKKCPLDPAFQADWAAKVKAVVAAARPRMVNIEDDYTLAWGRGLNGGGCFCERHLALFAKIYGKPLTAAEIAAAFERRTDENLPIRRAFAAAVRESLAILARKVRAAVDEVDPSVRICVCEPGASADKDGVSVESVARAFAGPNTRPAVRPSGAIYGAQTTPADVPGAVAHTFYTLERLPKDIETFYEADPYPHNRFFTSSAQMGSLMSGAVFAGAQNVLLYCLQYLDDPFEDSGYADEFNRLRPRLEAVAEFNRTRRAALRGVRIVWTSGALALTRGLGGVRDAQLADEAFVFSKFGLPYTTRVGAEGPAVLAGNIVESLSDAEIAKLLSGAVLVDAPAADLLAKRGFGRDLGADVKLAAGRLPVVREEILPAAGLTRRGRDVNAFYIFSAGTEGTVRSFATLAPHAGTEVWSRFYGVDGKEVTPSLTVAQNTRGGRVAVLATSLLGNRSSGLLNLRKQEMWRNLFNRIAPNALPVAALDAPGIWTLASVSEDGREMMVMVDNLSGDVREGLAFAVAAEWRGAAVSRLGPDGREETPETVSARWTPKCAFAQMQPEFFHFRRESPAGGSGKSAIEERSELVSSCENPGKCAWFQDARFGMFIHWGIYSIPGRGEWSYAVDKYAPGEYEANAKVFNPVDYNPRAWAKLAKAAGMKYAVLTSRHHDGFCMFDSHFTDYKVTNSPYGRDAVREFLEAFRAEGLKVGLYHSLPDWTHPGYADTESPECIVGGKKEPHVPTPEQYASFTNLVYNHINQLTTEYGKLDLLFLDYTSRTKADLDYFGRDGILEMVYRNQPGIIVNDRLSYFKDNCRDFDYYTPEVCVPNQPLQVKGREVPWETCATMNNSWGYCRADESWKTPEAVIAGLVGCVSKNGNLLLNVGPTERGLIPADSVNILKALADWYVVNGESVAGCGKSDLTPPHGCVYTQKGRSLYCHFLQSPLGDTILPQLKGKIEKVTLLRTGKAVELVDNWGFELLRPDEQRIRTRAIRPGDVLKIELRD